MGSGFKNFGAETAASGDIDGYLMRQSIMAFDDTTERDTDLTGLLEDGMVCYVRDINAFYFYDSGITLPTGGVSGWRPWYSQWGAFAPTWTNFTLGNGTFVGVYRWELGSLHTRGQVTVGSTSAFTGTLLLQIPAAYTGDAYGSQGKSVLNDTGTRLYSATTSVAPSGTNIAWTHGETGGLVNSTSPFTWANGDVFTWDIVINTTVAG